MAAWEAETDHGERRGPFDRVGGSGRLFLTGADVFYLVARALVHAKPDFGQPLPNLTAARTALLGPIRRFPVNLDFSVLQLADANHAGVSMKKARLHGAHLEQADLYSVDLEDTYRADAHFEGTNLSGAKLQDAYLVRAHLESADLSAAHLERAELDGAHMEKGRLGAAHLEGAGLSRANLKSADLRSAKLDKNTRLNESDLFGASFDQIVLDNANLSVVSWEGVAPLGDEKRARATKGDDGKRKSREDRIEDYEAAVRANRLLATELRRQGLAENADVFAYRAQIMQRKLNFRRRRFGRWSFSWLFAALSGYGYRLANIFIAYGLVLAVFAAIFWALGVHSYGAEPWYQALWDSFLVSLSAIHGRAVFEQLGAWTPAAWVAAIESVVGIVIEGVFVAMLIQRLFR